MALFKNMLAQLGQQQAQPDLGNLLKNTPSQPAFQSAAPAPFQASSLPWQQQIASAIDYGTAGGDAWNTIGKDRVIDYMGDSLRKKYGTDNLSDFRYVEDANVPGGYRLDWAGRQTPTGILSGLKNAARSTGLISGAPAGDASDGSPMTVGNPSEGLDFGATWEGEGGTTFAFYRKPDGSVGIKTASAQSNDTGDILTAAAILAGGYMAGTGALGGAAGGAATGAAEGAATGAATGGTATLGAGVADLGMAGFGQIGIPSAIPAGAGFGSLGTAGLAPVSTFGAGFGGGAIGSGLAGTLAAGTGALGGGAGGLSGGSGGAGTPPPANPYHPASYLDPTNLKNLAGSAMSNFSWTDLIGPGLQLVGGAMNAKAAGDASDDLLQASREAAARFEPWRQAGAWGIGRGATMMGKEGPEAARAAFMQDPGYQWRLEQGNKALERAASTRGGLDSGKFYKDAMRFNQGEATQEFGNSFNRLMALAGMGQTATQSSADYLTQGANAQAAGRVGQANAWNNALGQGYSMYQNNRLMRGLGY